MKPIEQTIFGFERGNCMQACIASIFEVPLDDIPNFMKDGERNYEYNLKKWCKDIGIICFDIDASGDYEKIFKDSYIIVGGKSPRDRSEISDVLLSSVDGVVDVDTEGGRSSTVVDLMGENIKILRDGDIEL